MNRTALLVVGVLASAAILVSTGAVPLQSTGTDEIPEADIEMRPADGPNGDYALINGDGEIELLLTEANPDIEGEGISEDSVANLDDVFTINYTGEGQAKVWITDDAEDVRFFRGDDPGASIEGENHSVNLSSDRTLQVGLHVDTRGEDDVESAEEFTVHAEVPDPDDEDRGGAGGGSTGVNAAGTGGGETPALSVERATLSTAVADPGETVTVTAVVENPTAMNATVWAPLLVDSTATTGTELTVPPGEARTVVFDVAFDDPGRYHVEVGAHAQQSMIASDTASAGNLLISEPVTATPTATDPGTPTETPGGSPTETETPTLTETPTATATDTNGSVVDVIDVRTTATPGNVSSAGPVLPVEEPLGIGPESLVAVFGGLLATVLALRAWRSRGGAL